MLSREQQRSLKALYDACASCHVSLRAAGEVIESEDLRARLLERAQAWQESAQELSRHLDDRQERSTAGPGVVASLRRTWMNLKFAVGDVDAMLTECSRRETEVRDRLEAARTIDLPHKTQVTLERILRRIGRLSALV